MSFFDRPKTYRLAGLLFLATVLGVLESAHADPISDWNAVTQAALAADGRRNGLAYHALVHAAMYDAVNAIDGRFAVLGVRPARDSRAASKDAAAAATAYRVLLALLPREAQLLGDAYAASLAAIPDGAAKTAGIALGEEVATAWLALRTDGEALVLPLYGSAPPQSAAPHTLAAHAVGRASPVATNASAELGSSAAPTIDEEAHGAARPQTETVEPPTTENATTFFARNLRELAAAKRLPIETNARLFAAVYVTQAGSTIECRDAQGYACLTTAFAEALRHFFGTPYVDLTLTSSIRHAAPRAFGNTRELIAQIEVVQRLADGGGTAQPPASVAREDVVAAQGIARRVANSRFALVSHR